jgi:hypothetical protein
MFKSTLDRNGQDVSANIDDSTEELKVDDLLKCLAQFEWDKKILTIENERLKLQIEWLFSMWKQGPLDLVQISPRSAMMITWLWLELSTQWLAGQLPLFEGENSAISKPLDEILDALEINGNIDYKMVNSIKEMEAFRNRVAAGDTPEIDEDIAVSFVLQAFDISKNIKDKLAVA